MEHLRIRAACKAATNIPYNELHGIQGALRIMSKERFEELKSELITKGFRFALSVWQSPPDGKYYIVDGHGRHAVVKHLVEHGYKADDLPCVYVEAASYEEAKKLVLPAISSYQQTTKEGLYEFISDLGIPFEELARYDIPGIDMDEFRVEFFDEPTVTAEDDPQKETVTFDAYKNAAVKQIVLLYAAEEYSSVISGLERLMGEMGVEDHSQVVWRLLSEKLHSPA
jgi:hypothetical protein